MSDEIRGRIATFLDARNTLTLATLHEGVPWASSVFFCRDESLTLYFLSNPQTWHGCDIDHSNHVSAAINEDCARWSDIQGLQIVGRAMQISTEDQPKIQNAFLEKFSDLNALFNAAPGSDGRKIADRLAKTPFYSLTPHWIRFIDNSRGFGFKEELVL